MTNKPAIYWDSSAIIKKYFQEEGSELVNNYFSNHSLHFTSEISHAEVLATIYRIRRDGLISETELKNTVSTFLSDWATFHIINYSVEVQSSAERIITTSSLRGADLVHLACAVHLLKEKLPIVFTTFDTRLQKAAIDHSLPVQK